MRIHILSDLHLEFGPIDLPPTPADLVILAGDIHLKLHGVRWIRHQLPDTPVLYLAGNHEYYGDKLPGLLDKIRAETAGTNIHFLEDESIRHSSDYRKIRPADTRALHAASVRNIVQFLTEGDPRRSVVITNHAHHPLPRGSPQTGSRQLRLRLPTSTPPSNSTNYSSGKRLLRQHPHRTRSPARN